MKKFYLLIVFLVLALSIIGFWYWQRNTYSKEVLKLEIIAPSQAQLGEEIIYTVRWKNNGPVRLENATLFFEYPKGSIPTNDSKLRIIRKLEDIYPGQEKIMQLKARLFGREGEVKEAKAILSYTPKSISAKFESETRGTTVISSVPLNFELDMPSRTESAQQFNFALNYFSNSEYPLTDLRIKLEYPTGFEFKEAAPSPIGEDEWKIGVLNKTEGGRILIKGKLQGNLQEIKVFKAKIGSWKEGEFTLFKEVTRGVEITKPKINITQTINGNTPSFVSPGDILHYEIFFKNVSERNLENLFLIIGLEGIAFDLGSITTENGSFQPGDNSIVFEAQNVPRLRFLGRDETGRVEFWVRVKDNIEGFQLQDRNLVLKNKVIISEAKEEFEVKVNSKLVIEQKIFYQDEVFGNSGPLPPRVGERTTYTIVWQAKNLFNDVVNAKVRATLPQGVELTGKIFPEASSLTFDSQSREIVWTIDRLLAGTGNFTTPASVAFQIALLPDALQRGNTVELIGKADITGDDTWTLQTIAGSALPLTTASLQDSSFSPNQGIVQ